MRTQKFDWRFLLVKDDPRPGSLSAMIDEFLSDYRANLVFGRGSQSDEDSAAFFNAIDDE